MKNLKVSPKLIELLLSAGVVLSLSGCQTGTVVDEKSTVKEEKTEEKTEEKVIEKQEENFDYFSSDVQNIEELIDQNKLEEVKDKAKDVFVSGVDFLFYDKEIKGVTFDELTEKGKEVTMDNLESLGEMVDQIVPGWREELSSKYQVAGDFVHDVYLSGLDKIKNYLGEENYQALENIKDKVKTSFHNTKEEAKSSIESWYQEFKSSK